MPFSRQHDCNTYADAIQTVFALNAFAEEVKAKSIVSVKHQPKPDSQNALAFEIVNNFRI